MAREYSFTAVDGTHELVYRGEAIFKDGGFANPQAE